MFFFTVKVLKNIINSFFNIYLSGISYVSTIIYRDIHFLITYAVKLKKKKKFI